MSRVAALRRTFATPTSQAEVLRALGGTVQFLLIARAIGASDYGRLAALVFAASVLGPAITVRATAMTVRSTARGEPTVPAIRRVLRVAAQASIGGALVAVVAAHVGALPTDATTAVVFLLAELAGGTLRNGVASIAQGRQQFDAFRNVVAVGAVARVSAAVLLTSLPSPTVTTWAWCLFLVTVPVSAILLVTYLARWRRHSTCEMLPPPVEQARSDAWVFTLNAFVERLFDDFDKWLLALTVGYAPAGVYAAGYRIASYVLVPTRAVVSRHVPRFFERSASSSAVLAEARAAARRDLCLMVACGALGLAAVAIVAPWLLGAGYADARPIALLLIPVLAVRGFHWIDGEMLTVRGRIRTRLLAQGAALGIPLLAYLVLVPRYGVAGAVAATLLGEVLALVVMRRLAARVLASEPTLHVPEGVLADAA